MFKNNQENRDVLKSKGYTREPSIEVAIHKIASELRETVEVWNVDSPELKVESDQDLREFNDALGDNYLENMENGK